MLNKANINPTWELGSQSISQALPSNMQKTCSQAQLPSTKPRKQPKPKTQPKKQTKKQVVHTKAPSTTTKKEKIKNVFSLKNNCVFLLFRKKITKITVRRPNLWRNHKNVYQNVYTNCINFHPVIFLLLYEVALNSAG